MQRAEQYSSQISRSVYALLLVVVIVFSLIFFLFKFYDSEINKMDAQANDYHLAVSKMSLQLLHEIDKIKLWFREYELERQQKTDVIKKESPLSPIRIELSERDQIATLKYEIDNRIEEISLAQLKHSMPEFKTINFLLKKARIKVLADLKEVQFTKSYSVKKIDVIMSSIIPVARQMQRLHDKVYNDIRYLKNKVQKQNKIQVFALILLLIMMGGLAIKRMLSHVRGSLKALTKAQNEIEKSQARFESMFESIPDAVVYADPERKIRMVNQAAVELFGFEEFELQGNQTKMLYASQDDFIQQGIIYYNSNSENQAIPHVVSYRHKNGNEFSGESLGTVVKSSTGEVLGYLRIIRDISEREHVDAILRSLAAGASGLNFNAFINNVLERLAKLYECKYAFIGQLQADKQHIKTLAVRVNDNVVDNFEYDLDGTPCQDILNLKAEIIPKDVCSLYPGDKMLVDMGIESYFGAPLIASNGSILGILSVMDTREMNVDEWSEPVLGVFAKRVSLEMEREQVNQELQQHQEQLEEQVKIRTRDLVTARNEAERANKAKSEFLSSMSHELRTPLNAILGFGQMLELNSTGLTTVQKSNVKEILDAGNHLLNLINEVLNLAKIESGKIEISMEKVDVTQLIHECMKLMSSSIDKMNLEVIDNISEHRYFVNADYMRLKQILLNLMSNAVKYNQQYGRIILDSRVNSQHIHLCVTDTGKGLTKDEVNKLFNPFERLDVEHNIEGTGIGLTITKKLTELMGGRVGVESTPGKGSTFWLEFELADHIMKAGNDE